MTCPSVRSLRFLTPIVLFAAFGVGCSSGEPSEQDILDAMEAASKETYEAMVKMSGEDVANRMRPEVHGVKKLACKEDANQNGFNCDVEVDVTGVMGRQKTTTPIRLVEGDDGWVIVR